MLLYFDFELVGVWKAFFLSSLIPTPDITALTEALDDPDSRLHFHRYYSYLVTESFVTL